MLFIGGTEGSGTRLCSLFCVKGGYYVGDKINKSYDAMHMVPFYNRWTRKYLENDYDKEEMTKHFRECVERHIGDNTNPLCAIKEPRSLLFLPFIHEIYPDAKFIHLVRRGMSMAFSGNKRHTTHYGDLFVDRQVNGWSPELAMKVWNDTNLKAFRYGTQHMGGQYLLLRFEDLCSKRVSEYDRLVDFAECSSEMIPAMMRKVKIPDTWKRGRKQNKQEGTRIERIGKEALDAFGYCCVYLEEQNK